MCRRIPTALVPLVIVGCCCLGVYFLTVEKLHQGMRKARKENYIQHAARDRERLLNSLQAEASAPSPPRSLRRPFVRKRACRKPAAAQERSPLYRLPREIREVIWEYAVGHRFVYHPQSKERGQRNPARDQHATRKTRALCPGRTEYPLFWQTHIRAPCDGILEERRHPAEQRITDSKQINWDYSSMTRRTHIRPYREKKGPFLEEKHWTGIDLLVTCRRIADEVTPVMFATNTFSFMLIEHFGVFRSHVGTSHLARIRYLHLDLLLGPDATAGIIDRPAWDAIWHLVPVELPALRELDLEVRIPADSSMLPWYGHSYVSERYEQFCHTLPDWMDSLASLQGRLRRARLMCNETEQSIGMRPDYRQVRAVVWKVQDRLTEMQAAITIDGTGGWMDLDRDETNRRVSGLDIAIWGL